MLKFRFLIPVLIVLAAGSCIAKKPPEPATTIQIVEPESVPESAPTEEADAAEPIAESEPEEDGQLMAYQTYTADYLAALASAGDTAEAEWNTWKRCRAATIAQAAQRDSELSNLGIEAELHKRLRAIATDGKSRAEGKRFYTHDAAGADDFRGPGVDAQIIMELLQLFQEANPAIPLCSQNAGELWRQVDQVLNAADGMARTAPSSTPVRVPGKTSGEVASDAD